MQLNDPWLKNRPEYDILARTLWAETRSEGKVGMRAVAAVIMNRVNLDLNNDNKPDWWGEGVIGVCLKPWQFSCWNDNDPNLSKLKAVTEKDIHFKAAIDIAKDAITKNGIFPDPVFGSTHYLVDSWIPKTKWARDNKALVKIGRHVFYRLT